MTDQNTSEVVDLVPIKPYLMTAAEREGNNSPLLLRARSIGGEFGTVEVAQQTRAKRIALDALKTDKQLIEVIEWHEEHQGKVHDLERMEANIAHEHEQRIRAEQLVADQAVIIEDLRADLARVTAANAMAVSS